MVIHGSGTCVKLAGQTKVMKKYTLRINVAGKRYLSTIDLLAVAACLVRQSVVFVVFMVQKESGRKGA